jgi:hypothetical protein
MLVSVLRLTLVVHRDSDTGRHDGRKIGSLASARRTEGRLLSVFVFAYVLARGPQRREYTLTRRLLHSAHPVFDLRCGRRRLGAAGSSVSDGGIGDAVIIKRKGGAMLYGRRRMMTSKTRE